MASLGGSAVVRHDLPMPLYGNLSRSPFHGMEDDLKKSAHDGYGGSTTVGSGPMMKTCFWCGYSSIRVSDLMTHMKTTHPHEYTANEAEMPPGLPPVSGSASPAIVPPGDDGSGAAAAAAARRYKCFSCEARFCRSGTLMDHMRRNHPETCVSLSDARRLSSASVWSTAGGGSGPGGGEAVSSAIASVARLPSAFGSESYSPGGGGSEAATVASSRKRAMQQRSESGTADDDEDDDELDIKVIRLVKQRLTAGDGPHGGSEPPFLGKLRATGWPGHVFRGAASVGCVEQQDLGCLLGVLRSAATADTLSRDRCGGGGVESAAASVSEGDCSSGGGSSCCEQPAGGGSIRLVRVSGVHASIVAGGKGGSDVGDGGVEVLGSIGSSSSGSSSSAAGGSNGGVGGAGSSLRAPEKYKCFWCDAHFRKRGKLMDHIDLFHKDSKQQTEVQAELLSSSSGAAAIGAESKQQRTSVAQPDAAAAVSSKPVAADRRCQPATGGGGPQTAGCKLPSPAAAAAAAAASAAANYSITAVGKSAPACRFVLRSAVHSESAPPADDISRPKYAGARSCKFYFGKLANPLTSAGVSALGHVIGRGGMGLPCGGGSAATAAAALNYSFALGPPPPAAAFGPPYAMYCVNGSAGNGVRFYQHHHHPKASFAFGACSPNQPSPYRLAAGAVLPAGVDRLVLPASAAQEAGAAAGCSALLLRRGQPTQQLASADAYPGADAPLDLSSRNGRR